MNYTYKKEKQFILITCILSFMQGLFYVYDGIITGFIINDFVLAALDFGYIPMILIWRKKRLCSLYLFGFSFINLG